MESVIWAFAQLHDKGLAYEGYRVLPYCWRDETPLSNHELRMDDDVYQSRQDPALTVGVRLETGELALLWTTTPWTLPSNQALAVGPDIDYVVVAPGAGTPPTPRWSWSTSGAPRWWTCCPPWWPLGPGWWPSAPTSTGPRSTPPGPPAAPRCCP